MPARCQKDFDFTMEISLSFDGQEPSRKDEKSHGGQEPPSKLARLDSSPSPKQRIVRTRPMEISCNKKTSRNNSEEDESKEDDSEANLFLENGFGCNVVQKIRN